MLLVYIQLIILIHIEYVYHNIKDGTDGRQQLNNYK